ncbi:MAG TPA: hypothetical protein VF306_04445 [Pirellulales bacterium]
MMGTSSPSFRKIVERRFEARMRDELPKFERVHDAISLGEQNYRLNLTDGVDLYVVLFADSRRDKVCTSIGWARRGADLLCSCRFEGPEHIDDAAGQIFCLSFFWRPHASDWIITKRGDDARCLSARKAGDVCFLDGEIERWISDHSALYDCSMDERQQRIYPVVDHMFARLLEHGVPYFEQLAAREGVPLRLRPER